MESLHKIGVQPTSRVFIGEQHDSRFLDSIVAETGPLDVVIDDGSHRAGDQIASLLRLWPRLSRVARTSSRTRTRPT